MSTKPGFLGDPKASGFPADPLTDEPVVMSHHPYPPGPPTHRMRCALQIETFSGYPEYVAKASVLTTAKTADAAMAQAIWEAYLMLHGSKGVQAAPEDTEIFLAELIVASKTKNAGFVIAARAILDELAESLAQPEPNARRDPGMPYEDQPKP